MEVKQAPSEVKQGVEHGEGVEKNQEEQVEWVTEAWSLGWVQEKWRRVLV